MRSRAVSTPTAPSSRASGSRSRSTSPSEGFLESELYALPPENYYLPAIEFTDGELAALRTALVLLDGQFAYAEPLRLALQQVSWGTQEPAHRRRERPDRDGDDRLGPAAASSPSAWPRSRPRSRAARRSSSRYYTMERDATADRKVDPYHLVFRSGQFYLIGYSHERDAVRVFRLSRIQGKVSYASKAEHDFNAARGLRPPRLRDPRRLADGRDRRPRPVFLRDRIDWLVERDYGEYGEIAPGDQGDCKRRARARSSRPTTPPPAS